jgi:hypothetical protein
MDSLVVEILDSKHNLVLMLVEFDGVENTVLKLVTLPGLAVLIKNFLLPQSLLQQEEEFFAVERLLLLVFDAILESSNLQQDLQLSVLLVSLESSPIPLGKAFVILVRLESSSHLQEHLSVLIVFLESFQVL